MVTTSKMGKKTEGRKMKILANYRISDSGIFFEFPSTSIKENILKEIKNCELVSLTIEKPYPTRSNEQNKFFWGIVQEIAKENGASFDDIEEEIKTRAMIRGYPYSLNTINGRPKPESMKNVTTIQMGYLIDEAIQFAAEMGIIINYQDPQYAILG